jgi:hypothetical protein
MGNIMHHKQWISDGWILAVWSYMLSNKYWLVRFADPFELKLQGSGFLQFSFVQQLFCTEIWRQSPLGFTFL